MKNPDADTQGETAKDIEYDDVSFSMMSPMAVLAIGLFVIGFANAAIVTILLDIFPM
jgi:multicomponent Na+:H+ antiporter subunit D